MGEHPDEVQGEEDVEDVPALLGCGVERRVETHLRCFQAWVNWKARKALCKAGLGKNFLTIFSYPSVSATDKQAICTTKDQNSKLMGKQICFSKMSGCFSKRRPGKQKSWLEPPKAGWKRKSGSSFRRKWPEKNKMVAYFSVMQAEYGKKTVCFLKRQAGK